MMTLLWVFVGVIAAVALGLFLLLRTYAVTANTLVALDQRCETAFADIDVHLRHRHNLVPGLVEVVKAVAGHERVVVLGIAEARSEALAACTPDARLKAERNLSSKVVTLLSSTDTYPELKAIPEFAQLRLQLTDCENRITAARRFYNLAIEEYNIALRQFPGSYIATRRRMNSRQVFDLGIERVLVDEPLKLAF